MTVPRRALALRIGGSVLVAGALLALFLLGRTPVPPTAAPAPDPAARKTLIAALDLEIDTVLAEFHIAAGSVRKRVLDLPDEGFTRTERLVTIPDSVAPVSVTAALNAAARRHQARAVASENLRLRTVTIHIELDGTVVHTVILRRAPRTEAPASRRPRPAT